MNEPIPEPSKAKRILTNAVKLALFLVMVGIVVQAGMTFFEPRPGVVPPEDPIAGSGSMGDWTFAGEGLDISVRSVEPTELEAELRGREPVAVDSKIPVFDGEKQILELLAPQPATETGADGRKRWRQAISGIEVFAETYQAGKEQRLAVARAAWSAKGEGLTLLEIRPSATSGGNEKSADRLFPVPEGATEMARRVLPTGEATGSLMTTRATPEAAGEAMKNSLSGSGWTVEPMAGADATSAKTMSCRKGDKRMHVVVFRENDAAEQTMIMCIRD